MKRLMGLLMAAALTVSSMPVNTFGAEAGSGRSTAGIATTSPVAAVEFKADSVSGDSAKRVEQKFSFVKSNSKSKVTKKSGDMDDDTDIMTSAGAAKALTPTAKPTVSVKPSDDDDDDDDDDVKAATEDKDKTVGAAKDDSSDEDDLSNEKDSEDKDEAPKSENASEAVGSGEGNENSSDANDSAVTLRVTAEDDEGKKLEGYTVELSDPSKEDKTNDEGIANIEGVLQGSYTLKLKNSSGEVVVEKKISLVTDQETDPDNGIYKIIAGETKTVFISLKTDKSQTETPEVPLTLTPTPTDTETPTPTPTDTVTPTPTDTATPTPTNTATPTPTNTVTPKPDAKVTVKVKALKSEKILKGYTIELTPKSKSAIKEKTDDEGYVYFKDMAMGEYTAKLLNSKGKVLATRTFTIKTGEKAEYKDGVFTIVAGKTKSISLSLRESEDPTNTPTPSEYNTTVNVQVIDNSGKALSGYKVALSPNGGEATSDANGNVKFDNIAMGDYTVQVLSADGKSALSRRDFKIKAGAAYDYKDNVYTVARGDSVSMKISVPVYTPTPIAYKVTLNVTVRDNGGSALSGYYVRLVPNGNEKGKWTGPTDAAGNVQFKDVEMGTYTMRLVDKYDHLLYVSGQEISKTITIESGTTNSTRTVNGVEIYTVPRGGSADVTLTVPRKGTITTTKTNTTSTKTPTPQSSKTNSKTTSAKTGDNSNILLYVVLFGAAAAALVIVFRKKGKSE